MGKKGNVRWFAALLLCLFAFLSGCTKETASTESSVSNEQSQNALSDLRISPVSFGMIGDGNSVNNHKITFSKACLAKMESKQELVVHYAPEKISPETLMEHLDIPLSSAKEMSDSGIVYANGVYSLDVYKNGNFCLFSNVQDTGIKEISLSDEACVKIAENFLRENNLLCDDLVLSEKIGEDKAVDEEKTLVVGKVVTYHPKTENHSAVFGNSKVSVRISPEGKVTELIYNHLHYAKSSVLSILDPEQALQQAKAQKNPTSIYFEAMDGVKEELKVENVRISYYENVMADEPSRQPVYVLEGGSGDSRFAISVSHYCSD